MSAMHKLKGHAVDWQDWHFSRVEKYGARYYLAGLWRLMKRRTLRALTWPARAVRSVLLARDIRTMRKAMAEYREECRRKYEQAQLESARIEGL